MCAEMMCRRATDNISGTDVDISVVEFSVYEGNSMSTAHVGVHRKELSWKLQVGKSTQPTHIKVIVDWKVLRTPEVGVECDGTQVFPQCIGSVSVPKSRLREDFEWTLPFRGTVKGIGMKDHFLIKPKDERRMPGKPDQWLLGTVSAQRPNGTFEAIVNMPDQNGYFRQVYLPLVHAHEMKLAGSMEAVSIPERTLKLTVPKDDPMETRFSVDTDELVTQHFARATPPHGKEAKVLFQVSQDRRTVTADVGHGTFAQFLSDEVRLVRHIDHAPLRASMSEAVGLSRPLLKQSWEVQVGPFATHLVEVERRHRSYMVSKTNKLYTVTIDGQLLVEATPEDLQSTSGEFLCKFMLKGEKKISFEVYETDWNGMTLDSKGIVNKKVKYRHECKVIIRDDKQGRYVDFVIDGTSASRLPRKTSDHYEPNIAVTPEALMLTYGIVVPFKASDGAAPPGNEDLSIIGLSGNYKSVTGSEAKNASGPHARPTFFGMLSSLCGACQDGGYETIQSPEEDRYDKYGKPISGITQVP